jgi:TldD protein
MTEPIQPERLFADRYGVSEHALERALGSALARRADYGDLYFELATTEALALEDQVVKHTSKDTSHGVGVRVLAGEKTGYAYSDEVTLTALDEAARTAGHIAAAAAEDRTINVTATARTHDLYALPAPPIEAPLAARIALLEAIDREARRADPRIKNVLASVVVEHKLVMIATSDGQLTSDVQPLARVQITCIAEDANGRQRGSFGGGGRHPFAFFLDGDTHLRYAREAARQALVNLDAVDAPAGEMTVVLGPGWPGILLHEAIGHGLEGDFNRKGTSAFSRLLGQRVGSELCTVIDDGTIPNRRGSLNVDDEGTPTERTVLIENGILRGYLHDRLNARLMGMAPTGNGRRESYAHAPMPRMTNTFMLGGASAPEDIIRSVDRGLYAVSFGGGQVDITNGKFVFSASEAYRIEGGAITRAVKGATLIGNGPDVLTRISMVGHDQALDEGIGMCGKNGQSVPVGVGLPTIRIDGLTVGGTQA